MEAAGRIKYHLQPFPIHSLSLSLGPFISPACLSLQSQLLPFPLSCHRRPRGCSPLPPPPPPPPSASPTDRPTDRPRQCLTPLSRLAAFLSPPPASRQSANHPGAMRSCRPPARLAVPSCVLHRATRRSTHSTRREFGGRLADVSAARGGGYVQNAREGGRSRQEGGTGRSDRGGVWPSQGGGYLLCKGVQKRCLPLPAMYADDFKMSFSGKIYQLELSNC